LETDIGACRRFLLSRWDVAGKKGRSSKGSGRASSDGRAPAAKIQHDMDTLGLLAKLKLPVPKTVAEVEDVAATVTQRKAEYERKQAHKIAGEDIPEEDADFDEAGGVSSVSAKSSKAAKSPSAGRKGTVSLHLRCDEALGFVLVELAAH
jgi:hypothetical protein